MEFVSNLSSVAAPLLRLFRGSSSDLCSLRFLLLKSLMDCPTPRLPPLSVLRHSPRSWHVTFVRRSGSKEWDLAGRTTKERKKQNYDDDKAHNDNGSGSSWGGHARVGRRWIAPLVALQSL